MIIIFNSQQSYYLIIIIIAIIIIMNFIYTVVSSVRLCPIYFKYSTINKYKQIISSFLDVPCNDVSSYKPG